MLFSLEELHFICSWSFTIDHYDHSTCTSWDLCTQVSLGPYDRIFLKHPGTSLVSRNRGHESDDTVVILNPSENHIDNLAVRPGDRNHLVILRSKLRDLGLHSRIWIEPNLLGQFRHIVPCES